MLLAAALAVLHSDPALAAVTGPATAAAGYGSATLAPPTALSFTKTCSATAGSSTVTLKWTATASTYATGYQLTYTKNGSSAGTTPVAVTGRTTVTATYTISNAVSYNLTLAAAYRSWTSQTNPSTAPFTC